jgi:hypothetical protein
MRPASAAAIDLEDEAVKFPALAVAVAVAAKEERDLPGEIGRASTALADRSRAAAAAAVAAAAAARTAPADVGAPLLPPPLS